MDPCLREAQGEVLIEGVETPDVREDHDPGPAGLLCSRRVPGEPGPVRRCEHDVPALGRAGPAGDGRQRRAGVRRVAHGADSTQAGQNKQMDGVLDCAAAKVRLTLLPDVVRTS